MSGARRGSPLRVAVTRAADQADPLAAALVERGAVPIVVPLLRIAEPEDPAPLRAAVDRLPGYDWLVFTSANGVAGLARALGARRPIPAGPRIACVGPATAQALAAHGRAADLVPDRYDAAALAAALAGRADRAGRVLWPRGDRAAETLAEDLTRAGMHVDAPVAYRTIAGEEAERLAAMMRRGELDVVTLTSPSAARALAAALGGAAVTTRIAVIGPVTAAAARAAGLPVHIEPTEHTLEALARAVTGGTSGR